ANVQREASAISDLYHLAPNMPTPVGTKLQAAIRDYAEIVVNQEWKLMRAGHRSPKARAISLSILGIVSSYEPTAPSRIALQQEAFGLVKAFTDERRSRIFDNQEAIPGALWLTMIFIGVVTIGSSYFFQVRNFQAHLLMTIALAAVIGSIFVLIVEFDLPFRGDISVPPTAFVHFLHDVDATPAMQ
ncbi:MAG: bestrophin-like domain, partial [Vulcanimicrobiaceae bacterium]